TGGCGFIGHYLIKALRANDEDVRVLDNCSRGKWENIRDDFKIQFYRGDIRKPEDVDYVMRDDVTEVIHLAYINGTKTFYERPDEVLEVGVKGICNVIDACTANGVRKLTLASSSEVCRAKLDLPDEAIPLVIPDPMNPRYSYSAGKIISEMMAIHNAKLFDRLLIFRPFNIYGPGMASGHVVPDFLDQLKKLNGKNPAPFPILGNGDETRSFCYIDDLISGIMLMRKKGDHMGIYNIGMPEEVTIADLARKMAGIYGREIIVQSGDKFREGDAARRRPDISKMRTLGYEPKIALDEGLRRVMQ
ncbi:MAG TPA: NAD-dependent epimerase/dehydratase family protein, partial [Anaerolineae bacterium]|nr:NAD-dependent epimerase/dehydratase family protein [Anaerolineae bacterium]